MPPLKIIPLTSPQIPLLKPLLTSLFPVSYPPAFYTSLGLIIEEHAEKLCFVAVDGKGGISGVIFCRFEKGDDNEDDDDGRVSEEVKIKNDAVDGLAFMSTKTTAATTTTATSYGMVAEEAEEQAQKRRKTANQPQTTTATKPLPKNDSIYIMTIGVLPAYRGKGYGKLLLGAVLVGWGLSGADADADADTEHDVVDESINNDDCKRVSKDDDNTNGKETNGVVITQSPLLNANTPLPQSMPEPTPTQQPHKPMTISLHVQTTNASAIRFYSKLNFVQVGGVIKGYYRRITDGDCFVLEKRY